MFLSRLVLSLRHHQARRDLSNPYEMHRTIRSLQPEGPHPLWRLEDELLLIQSSQELNTTGLPEGYLTRPPEQRPLDIEGLTTATKPLRFRLRTSPTVAKLNGHREGDGRRKTKRHAIFDLEEQLQWFNGQAHKHGFQPLGVMVSEAGYLLGFKKKEPFRIYQATFDGHIKVVDRELFSKAIVQGLSHGKTWGLGLLSVR